MLAILAMATVLLVIVTAKLETITGLNILERMSRIKDDGGSGRNVMYLQIIDGMKQSTLLEWIIGHGFGRTVDVLIIHDTAHNDFLEILYNYGLFPMIMFILFYLHIIREGINMWRKRYEYAGVYMGAIVISLLLSLLSTYCVSYAYVTCGMACLGVIMGDWYKMRYYYEINNSNNAEIA